MSGTNVTEDVIKSIKCNANRKQFLFFDKVVMVFNLLIVPSLILTFLFTWPHIINAILVTLINETSYALLRCSMLWSLYDSYVANGNYSLTNPIAVFGKCLKFQMIIAQS